MNFHDKGVLSALTGVAAAAVNSARLSNVASVCSLIRVGRKLSLSVFDDVLGLIREARECVY